MNGIRLVRAEEMAAIDRAAQDQYQIPAIALMESAGAESWTIVRRLFPDLGERRIVFVAGAGNNGGDALVMARYAQHTHSDLRILLARGEPRAEALTNLKVCNALGIAITEDLSVLADADLIVDGIAGTGLRGAIRAPLDQVVYGVNEAGADVVSIDVPSGLSDDFAPGSPIVIARDTLTMGLAKRCLYLPAARAACGQIHVVRVGFPQPLLQPESADTVGPSAARDPCTLLDPKLFRDLLPLIDESAYKTKRGVLWVLAGSAGASGAAILGAEAGARSRAGLVSLYADEAVYDAAAAQLRSVMVKPLASLPNGAERAGAGSAAADALLIGPGWGVDEERAKLLQAMILRGPGGVLDADAITLLGEMSQPVNLGGEWVLTPHPGELARLMKSSTADVLARPYSASAEAAARVNAVVVLKSHVTYIADPGGAVAVVDGMNAALGTGGSGDVLAGVIAGLRAAGIGSWQAACAGVMLHSHAGRLAREQRGLFLAEELLPLVSKLAEGRA